MFIFVLIRINMVFSCSIYWILRGLLVLLFWLSLFLFRFGVLVAEIFEGFAGFIFANFW